jgi:hypothetical protein
MKGHITIGAGPGVGARQIKVSDPNGSPILPENPRDKATVLGLFGEGDFEAQEDAGQEAPIQSLPGDLILQSEYGSEEARSAFFKATALSKNVFNQLTREEREAGGFGKSPNELGTYISGGRGQSLELQFAKAKAISIPEGGEPTTIPLDQTIVQGAAKTLTDLLEAASKNKLSGSNKEELKSQIILGSDGSVTLLKKGSQDEGLVVKDKSNFLKTVVKSINRKFDVDFEVIDTAPKTNERSDNVFRGTSMEEILPVISAVAQCSRAQKAGLPEAKALCENARTILQNMRPKVSNLIRVHKEWAAQYHTGQIAISNETKATADAIKDMYGDEAKGVMTAITTVSRQAIETRQPDFIVPTGKDISLGEKTDVAELWGLDEAGGCSRAEEGLMRQGYSLEEIRGNKIIEQVPVKNIFKDRPDLLDSALKTGKIKKGGNVCINRNNMKNYLVLNDGKLGELVYDRTRDFLSGNLEGGKNGPAAQRFTKVIRRDLGLDDARWADMQVYQSKMDKIEESVRSLQIKAVSKAGDGTIVKTSPFKQSAQNMVNMIKTKSSYGEIIGKQPKAELIAALDKQDLESKEGVERSKELLARYLRTRQVQKDIDSGDQSAKDYLAAKAYVVGGSLHEGEMCDWRSLKEGKIYNFRQNDSLKIPLRGWLDGTGEYDLSVEGYSYSWTSKNNTEAKLILREEGTSNRSKEGFKRLNRSTLRVSRGLADGLNRTPQLMGENKELMEMIMKNQKDIFSILLNLGNTHHPILENQSTGKCCNS